MRCYTWGGDTSAYYVLVTFDGVYKRIKKGRFAVLRAQFNVNEIFSG